MQESTPIRDEAIKKGLVVTRSLPHRLPGKSSPVPDSQYVLLKADSGMEQLVALAVPIPFVTEYAVSRMNQSEAKKYKDKYADIDPYLIAVERMMGSPLLSKNEDALKLFPFVYVLEGSDEIPMHTGLPHRK
jgi:hypothetical protein